MEIQKHGDNNKSVSALLRCLCAFFLVVGIQVTSVAQETVIYGVSHIGRGSDSKLHRLDPLTGAAKQVGEGIGFRRVSGMDFEPATGILYATGERQADAVNVLLIINPRTGVGTEIGPTGVADFLGVGVGDGFDTFSDLSFRADGTLFGFSYPGQWVATINLATGEATQLAWETERGDRGILANDGNALAFVDSVLIHAGSETPDEFEIPACKPDCFSALHVIDLGTNLVTSSVALIYPVVFPFVNDIDDPRANGMDYDAASDTLFASIIYGFSGNGATFLGTIDPMSGAVGLIGQTQLGMDALAVISSADLNAVTLNFSGQLDIIQEDNGLGIYSNSPVGTVFSGAFNDLTADGFISDGTTVTSVSCCIFASGLGGDNDSVLEAESAILINALAGTSFVEGALVDIVSIESDALIPGGGRIEVGLIFILDPGAFDEFRLETYPLDQNDVLIALFFIAEFDAAEKVIFSAAGAVDTEGDGIQDAIDGTFTGVFNDQSTVVSNAFTDQQLSGSTFGSVVARSDNMILIADDQAQGVSLTAVGGAGTTEVQMCANPGVNVLLTDGDQIAVTCGSFTGEVLSGPVSLVVGTNIGVTIPAGAIAFIEEMPGSILSISNLGETGGPVIVIDVGGTVTNLKPKEEIVLPFQDTVSIDISPWSRRNLVIPKSRRFMVVVVHSTDLTDGDAVGFDALDIDESTVTFGPAGAAPRFSFFLDVDHDHDDDAIFIFKTRDTGIECGDTEATLTGRTFAGNVISGSDSIRTIFCK